MKLVRILFIGAAFGLWNIGSQASVGTGRTTGLNAQEGAESTAVIGYYISPGYPGSGYREGDGQLADWAFTAWEKASNGGLRFVPVEESDARVRLYWVGRRDGFYGEARPTMVAGRQGTAVLVRPDMRGLGPGIEEPAKQDRLFRDSVVYLTCLHEVGHALGLPHTADEQDIMYWFGYGGDIPGFFRRYRDRLDRREDIPQHFGLSERDVARLRAQYPGR